MDLIASSYADSHENLDLAIHTLFHDDEEFLTGYVASIIERIVASSVRVEVVAYVWGSNPRFLDDVVNEFSALPNYQVLAGPNIGFSRGNNALVARTTGRFVLLLNPDTRVQSFAGLPEESGELLVYAFSQQIMMDRAGMSSIVPPLGFDVLFHPLPQAKGSWNYADGAALGASRRSWETLEGLDQNVFVFLDDVDLSIRAHALGGRVLDSSLMAIEHYSGGTVPGGASSAKHDSHETSVLRRVLTEKNALYLALKYLNGIQLLWWIPLWLSVACATSVGFLMARQFRLAITPFEALHLLWLERHSVRIARKDFRSVYGNCGRNIVRGRTRGLAKWKVFRALGIPVRG